MRLQPGYLSHKMHRALTRLLVSFR
jgi:hypothetical protein